MSKKHSQDGDLDRMKDNSLYMNDIEMLDKRWNVCMAVKENYIDEWSQILSSKSYFIPFHDDLSNVFL